MAIPVHAGDRWPETREGEHAEKYDALLVDDDGKRLDTSWYGGQKDGAVGIQGNSETARRRAAGELQDLSEVAR